LTRLRVVRPSHPENVESVRVVSAGVLSMYLCTGVLELAT
jgi:hypothetical protein